MRRIRLCSFSALISYYFSKGLPITALGLILLGASVAPADQKAEPKNNRPPWSSDVAKMVMPQYPGGYPPGYRFSPEQSGIFRLSLDLKTGRVTDVTVVKSTGHCALDGSAIKALRQWQFKPGKWTKVYVPVKFAIPGSLPGRATLVFASRPSGAAGAPSS
jgi:TonB family protein